MLKNIEYRLVTKDDYEAVLDLLRNHYYWDEPVKKALGPQFQDFTEEEMFYLDNLKNYPPTSIAAVCRGKIVGAVIAGPLYPDEYVQKFELAKKVSNPKLKAEIILYAALERDSNIFERFKIDRAFQVHSITVHSDYRGLRIGLKLSDKIVQRGRNLGYPILTCDCTSVYSASLAEQLGLECVNMLKMADFRDPSNGEQVLFPKDESKVVKTFIKVLTTPQKFKSRSKL